MKRSEDPIEAAGNAVYNIIIGTAGHIDHGKTSLVEKLTGINADRLPEEKERGMTIDLGFARYRLGSGLKVGVIDVPGHERFVKNMVAGATSIDLVLLVVAADDGVMPQTREHLEIMKLLGIRHGIIVVTKIDLVSEDLRELAIEDVRDTVRGTFLEDAPLVPVSSMTGEGYGRLVEVLEREIAAIPPRATEGSFRMPIQRVFSSKGFGTVVTGVPISGSARVGDVLEILPLEKSGRLRGVQAYASPAELAQAGQSSALNLADLDYKEIHRGMVAATPGRFRFSDMIEARFQYLAGAARPLKHLTEVRFHCGTAEVLGLIYLLEGRAIQPGDSSLVQIRLEEPVVAAPGDRYVLRLHSPMVTLGGGEVLDLSRWRLKQGKAFVIEKLAEKEKALGTPRQMVLNAIEERGFESVSESDPAPGCGIPPERVAECLADLLADGSLRPSGRSGQVASARRFEEARERLRRFARVFFDKNPRRLLMEKVVLRQSIRAGETFLQDLLATMEREGEIETVRGEFLRWSFHAPKLTEDEQRFRDRLEAALRDGRFSPLRVEEIAAKEGFQAARAAAIAELLVEEGRVVAIAEDILFHREAVDEARRLLREHLEKAGPTTASEAKNVLGSSRRYIIPLLELFDKEGLTVRRGDVRELRKLH